MVIVHDDDVPFGQIAVPAPRIAAVLYPSDIRWSAISNGRDADLPNGVTVRFVAESNLSAADQEFGPYPLDSVPDDEEELAKKLFGASSASVVKPVARGWRDRFSAVPDPALSIDAGNGERSSWEGRAPAAQSTTSPLQGRPSPADFDVAATKVWDRHPSADASADVEVEVDPLDADAAVATLAADMAPAPTGNALPFVPPSIRPPAMGALEASSDPGEVVDDDLSAPSDRRETRVISADEARRAVEAATLPFKPKPPAREHASIPAGVAEWEPTPRFRGSKTASVWRWIALSVFIAGALIAVLYLLFSGDSSAPAATSASVEHGGSTTTVPTAVPPLAASATKRDPQCAERPPEALQPNLDASFRTEPPTSESRARR